jgi:hypothetical protein
MYPRGNTRFSFKQIIFLVNYFEVALFPPPGTSPEHGAYTTSSKARSAEHGSIRERRVLVPAGAKAQQTIKIEIHNIEQTIASCNSMLIEEQERVGQTPIYTANNLNAKPILFLNCPTMDSKCTNFQATQQQKPNLKCGIIFAK